MKLIALRMDEEEKARLEQLASERHVTLSTAFREGAKLYLGDAKVALHRRSGEPVTWLGVRRRNDGSSLDAATPPNSRQAQQIRAFRSAVLDRGLGSIRESWDNGATPPVVLAAVAQWLTVIGTLYTREPTRWDLFLADYTVEWDDEEKLSRLRLELRHALTDGVTVNPAQLLTQLEAGVEWLIRDLHDHDEVRRTVLIGWGVFRREREASGAKSARTSVAPEPRPA